MIPDEEEEESLSSHSSQESQENEENGWISITEGRNQKGKAILLLKKSLDQVNVDLYAKRSLGGYKLEA